MIWLLLFTIILTIFGLAFLASLIIDLAEHVDKLDERIEQAEWRLRQIELAR